MWQLARGLQTFKVDYSSRRMGSVQNSSAADGAVGGLKVDLKFDIMKMAVSFRQKFFGVVGQTLADLHVISDCHSLDLVSAG